MHAIRQKCRPKHQVLILKCYPRTTKGAVDVKPNSSELSYLLYYATTRRSKVQKVGAFLEKKTASDVSHAKIGDVQVTLQILAALIEKAPRDLPLYAPYVLKIFHLILRSDDITLVESSLPTFEAFCEHHDAASLSADQEYLRQYEEIVRLYAQLASTRPKPTKVSPSAPVAMRWRMVGLKAVKSVASSEALASVAGRQLDVIMPMLLENLWTDNSEYVEMLLQRAQLEEKIDVEKILRRRTSIATVRTAETSDTNPAALSGSTADADKSAEEDIGVLAIQCLKQIFVVNNRAQIYLATRSFIKFTTDMIAEGEEVTNTDTVTGKDQGWATTIFLIISRWAPVQDRHVILVTTMETLTRCSITEDSLPQQLVLATMISSLLSSEINLIGLGVMDILLSLIQQVLRILQLGGSDQQQPLPGLYVGHSPARPPSKEPSPSTSAIGSPITEKASTPSSTRKKLLDRLQQCIGDLATHVYYADQISDMIAAILLRLKPSPLSAVPTPLAAIEDPEAANNAVTASANLTEDRNTDEFFSFDTAKVTALKAIKSILLVATQRNISGAVSLGRSRVGLSIWEGTQWLLRDTDGRVRKAYVDALLTWLSREMTKTDLRAFEEKTPHSVHKPLMKNGGDDSTTSLTKRAVSNASKSPKPSKTTFIQLLHLAIYENALQYVDSETDVILLHVLLVTLVEKLGVNTVRSGLPMIFRLQEDIQEVETMAKVRLGSLCHGYYSALIEKFNLESSSVAREVHSEIIRRQSKGFWVDMIRLPPARLDQIGQPGAIDTLQALPMDELESESLLPFDNREGLVELIAISYSEHMGSPPTSPPTSPGRSGNQLGQDGQLTLEYLLPPKIKEELLSEWSKETVVDVVQESSKSESISGSRGGTGSGRIQRNFLTVNGNLNNDGANSGTHSPKSQNHHHHHHHHHHQNSRPPSQAYGLVSGFGSALKSTHGKGESPLATSDSSHNCVNGVDHLKKILSGQAPPSRGYNAAHSDASSDSMVSYEGATSEYSADNRGTTNNNTPQRVSADLPRSKSRERVGGSSEHLSPLGSNPVILRQEIVPPVVQEDDKSADVVPPVPPLPPSLSQERIATVGTASQDSAGDISRNGRGLKSRGRQNHDLADEPASAADLLALLDGIATDMNSIKSNGNVGVPPY